MTVGADEWWRGAERQLAMARVLSQADMLDGAYFHAGQAVEFGIKALYLKRNNLRFMPDENKGARWHDLGLCGMAARLKGDLNQRDASAELKVNWRTVKDWNSNARFPSKKVARRDMDDFCDAVWDAGSGVWPWLEKIYLKT